MRSRTVLESRSSRPLLARPSPIAPPPQANGRGSAGSFVPRITSSCPAHLKGLWTSPPHTAVHPASYYRFMSYTPHRSCISKEKRASIVDLPFLQNPPFRLFARITESPCSPLKCWRVCGSSVGKTAQPSRLTCTHSWRE